MTNRPDERSSIAVAFGWASRITTTAVGMVIPGLVGFWLDQRLGTLVLFTLLGFGSGVTIGIWQLVRMTSSTNSETSNEEGDPGECSIK